MSKDVSCRVQFDQKFASDQSQSGFFKMRFYWFSNLVAEQTFFILSNKLAGVAQHGGSATLEVLDFFYLILRRIFQ